LEAWTEELKAYKGKGDQGKEGLQKEEMAKRKKNIVI